MRPCLLVLVAACGPGKSGDGMSSETSGHASTGIVSDSVSTVSTNATEATSAGATATSGVTISGTTEPFEATTTSSTGAEPTTGGLPWGECAEPYLDWDEEHVDCVVDWPTTTKVHGEGPAAGLMPVTRVYFGVGYYACTPDGLELHHVVIDDPFMPAAVLYGGAACGPELWIGEYEREGQLSGSETPLGVTMTIHGFTGDWTSANPVDPPRIFGTFAGDLVGPYEAVHCAALDEAFWNCG